MFYYFSIILIILMCAYFYDFKSYQKNKLFWFNTVLCLLICLSGFRYQIGTDSFFYEREFQTYPKLFDLNYSFVFENRYAPLYVVLNSLVRSITSHFWVLQFILSVFINTAFFSFIKQFGRGKIDFTIIFFYFCTLYYNLNCEVLRESIAVGLFLFSIGFLNAKKYSRYFLLIFIAIGFHFGAVLLLPVPFFRRLHMNKKFILIAVIIISLSPLIKQLSLSTIINLALNSSFFIGFASSYISEDFQISQGVSINTIILQFILPIICYFYVKSKSKEWQIFDYLLICYLFFFWFSVLFIPIFIRYNNYLSIIYYYYYAAAIVELSKRLTKNHYIVFLLLLVPFSYTNYNSWTNAYIDEKLSNRKRIELINPYTSIFDPVIIPNRRSIYEEVYKY